MHVGTRPWPAELPIREDGDVSRNADCNHGSPMIDRALRRALTHACTRRAALLAVVAALVLPPAAWAVPIVQWDLASATGQTADPLLLVGNVSATAIAPSAGVTPWSSTAQDGFVAASGWAASAPDPGRYYEWQVTAGAGYAIDYRTIDLALFRGVQGSDHGAEQWDLRASTDGFATSDLFLRTFDISASGADEQITFAGADISGLGTLAGTVTFRLYGYDYTSAADFSGLGNDTGWLIGGTGPDPVVDGQVVSTPEPGSGVLLMLGLLGLAWAGRREVRGPAPRQSART